MTPIIPKLHSPRAIGHHWSADAVWLHEKFGLEVIEKCILDTEFAQQTVDESSELKLERGISMKYTTLGRYDLDLTLWKKDNRKLCENGYGFVPDEIIIPYGVRDVIAVMRAYPIIRQLLKYQKLDEYYDTIFNPFVTDVFVTFAIEGLNMDIAMMDELRELFNFTKKELDREFKVKVHHDARKRFLAKLMDLLGMERAAFAMTLFKEVTDLISSGHHEEAWTRVKAEIPLDKFKETKPFLEHLAVAPDFNIRSSPDMRRWLFDVSGCTPVKTTNQKSKGMPSMDWEKVLDLPKEKQALYTPACDKQTLQILAVQLPLVDELLDLNVVGNLCKAFLKEPEVYFDEDLGEEVVDEAGLHKWLCSDGRIHGQTSTTETGRPRGHPLPFPRQRSKQISLFAGRVAEWLPNQQPTSRRRERVQQRC